LLVLRTVIHNGDQDLHFALEANRPSIVGGNINSLDVKTGREGPYAVWLFVPIRRIEGQGFAPVDSALKQTQPQTFQ
jgi:hypothetical protein